MLDVLGLASLMESRAAPVSDEAAGLRDAREAARRQRDWAEADRLRDQLRALGWEVRDGPDGPELLPAA
jgi:cysteinyl-tRNA synthetase